MTPSIAYHAHIQNLSAFLFQPRSAASAVCLFLLLFSQFSKYSRSRSVSTSDSRAALYRHDVEIRVQGIQELLFPRLPA